MSSKNTQPEVNPPEDGEEAVVNPVGEEEMTQLRKKLELFAETGPDEFVTTLLRPLLDELNTHLGQFQDKYGNLLEQLALLAVENQKRIIRVETRLAALEEKFGQRTSFVRGPQQ